MSDLSQAGHAIASTFRNMQEADVPHILRIERQMYEFPWSETVFRDCLRAGYHCQILTIPDQGDILGYGVMAAAVGEAHILNLCVSQPYQGKGWAQHILQHLLHLARTAAAQIVFLEVRTSNVAAQRLYTISGFCEIGLRNAYYPAAGQRREDALVLAKQLA